MTGFDFARMVLWSLAVLAGLTLTALFFLPVRPEDHALAAGIALDCAVADAAALATLAIIDWVEPRFRAGPSLGEAQRERAQARVADIELGLATMNAAIWQDEAIDRIAQLREEDSRYGLFPHEQAELEQLEALVADVNRRLRPANG